jgi:hypothetical protein
MNTKLRVVRLTLSVLAIACMPIVVIAQLSGAQPLRVVASGVWLRSQPSVDAAQVRILPKGTLLCAGARIGSFIEVRAKIGGRVVRGYVSRGFANALGSSDTAANAMCEKLWKDG